MAAVAIPQTVTLVGVEEMIAAAAATTMEMMLRAATLAAAEAGMAAVVALTSEAGVAVGATALGSSAPLEIRKASPSP